MAFLYGLTRARVGRWFLVGMLLCGGAGRARAQGGCLLVPVPLAQRVATAPLIVEARADRQQPVAGAGGHIYTVSQLTVFKVFRGTPPPLLRLAEPGGTLGLRREVVSSTANVVEGQQGLFLLEPDPANPGTYRLQYGPQGLVRYDLPTGAATDPFAQYAAIAMDLYPAVERVVGQAFRAVQANAGLGTTGAAARPTVGAISSFAPASLTAGTNTVLTIVGSGFGTSQGSGRVEFPNADNGGGSFVAANATDYVQWTDGQIQVQVPSVVLATGGTAGTGTFRVISAAAEVLPSPTPLTVRYALTNVAATNIDAPNRPRLVNDDAQGGYTLTYSPSFTAAAQASFERALATWACATRLRRAIGAGTAPEATTKDNVNAVRFGPLNAGILGVANSYYSGCIIGGVIFFSLDEMDYTFSNTANFQFGTAVPTGAQADFESVALHELGHGTQLNHLIDPAAVMHYVLVSGQTRRVLNASTDIAAGQDVFTYSATNPCSNPVPVAAPVPTGCAPLPVELVAFEARYTAGRGTALSWATASEHNSAYFAVEAQEDGAKLWAEILRLEAAGSTSSFRRYAAHDARLLSGRRYYRLRQVDADGSTSYSPVATVAGSETGLALYPNPVADRLQVSGPAQAGRLTCYDLAGRVVAQFELVPGPNTLDVSALHAGLYQVAWTDGQTLRRSRLQKL